MEVKGWMSGSNSMLESVMGQGASFTGESYSERAINGRRIATTMRQQEVGKNAARQMQAHAEETEESLEEQVAKQLEEKKAAEKAQAELEAKRIEQKLQGSAPSSSGSAQGDKVEISEAGQTAAQGLTVARNPTPAQISTPAPVVETSSPVQVRTASQAEQVDVKV